MEVIEEFEYKKTVELSALDVVEATIWRVAKGKKTKATPISIKFFSIGVFFRNLENTFKKAHEWADERIKVCEQQEISMQLIA